MSPGPAAASAAASSTHRERSRKLASYMWGVLFFFGAHDFFDGDSNTQLPSPIITPLYHLSE